MDIHCVTLMTPVMTSCTTSLFILCFLQDLRLVTDQQLGILAEKISSKSMKRIAIVHMGFQSEEVDNLTEATRDNKWDLMFNLLRTWRNKHATNAKEVKFCY